MKKIVYSALSLVSLCVQADMNLTNDIWNISFERSQFDDSVSVEMKSKSLDSFEFIGVKRAEITVRCTENKTDVIVNYPDIFLSNRNISVEYRLDKDKSQKSNWTPSSNYQAMFIPKPISFIQSMFDKERLTIRVTPYGKSPIISTFNISGLKDSIEPLRKICKW